MDQDKDNTDRDELLKDLQFYREILHDPFAKADDPFTPWPDKYIMLLWDDPEIVKVLNFYMLGDQLADDPQNEEALQLLVERYLGKNQIIPPVARPFFEGMARALMDSYNEELRDNPRNETEWWKDAVGKPAILTVWNEPEIQPSPQTVYEPAKKQQPSFKEWFENNTNLEIINLVRGRVKKHITGDLKSRAKPYGKQDEKLMPLMDIDQYDHQFTPARDLIAGKLEALGYDTNPMGNDLLALTSLEVNKLTEHEVELLVRFERGELEQYARECGKSVSALYKQRERLRNRIQKNVQNEINKLDAI